MKTRKVYSKRLKRHTWQIDFTSEKERLRVSGFATRREAEEAYAAVLTRKRAERFGMALPQLPWTLGALEKKVEADPKWKERLAFLRSFRSFIEYTGRSMELTKIRQTHLADWMETIKKKGEIKPNSIYTYARQVIAVLNAAPIYFPDFEWKAPRLPMITLDPGRDRVLTAEEIRKLIAALQSDRARMESHRGISGRRNGADLFRLALLVPAREAELLALRPADVNLDWMTISINSTKVNRKRVIPLSSAALAILQSRWPEKGKAFFAGFSANQLRRALMKASVLADVEYGDQVEGGWIFHDLRHTAATTMAANGIDYSTLAEILGHSRRDMTARYIHPTLDSQRKAVEALETFYLTLIGASPKETRQHLVSSF